MKLAVVNTSHPFVRGGAEVLADSVVEKLNEFGHAAELVKIPHSWESAEAILRGAMAAALFRIPNVDRVVALKFPAYYVPHDNKVVWICHQLRQVYDLWRKPEGFGTEPAHLALRRQVRALDRHRLWKAQRYAISDVTRERLERFTGLDAAVLYPPLPTEQGYDCAGYGEFVFCPGRFVYLKRQELLIRALAQTRTPVRLHLAGAVEDAREIERLADLAASLGVTGRLTLEGAFIPEARKKQLLADALAVAYVPIDEDYGYVPLEAIASRKAVITATDSGGALTAVRHLRNGLIVEPSPKSVAEAMDRLYEDRSLAERLGHAGAEVLASLGISWAAVIDALTGDVSPRRADFP